MTIESVGIDDLKIYQDISFSLIKSDLRPSVWNIYEKWQKLLKKSGYITIEQLRREALDRVTKRERKEYDAVIIDEAQDLSRTALKLLIRLTQPSRLFLTADTSQSIYERHLGWNFVQQEIRSGAGNG